MKMVGPEGAPFISVAYDDLITTTKVLTSAPLQHTAFQLIRSNTNPSHVPIQALKENDFYSIKPGIRWAVSRGRIHVCRSSIG